MSRYLIIDGNNILHFWKRTRRLLSTERDRRAARDLLSHECRRLQDFSGERIVLVFDGRGAVTTEERETHGLQIIYAAGKDSADTVIERLASRHASKLSLRVATGDTTIATSISASGALWCDPASFITELEQPTPEAAKLLRKYRRPSP